MVLVSSLVYRQSACQDLGVPANCPDGFLLCFAFLSCSFQDAAAWLICKLLFEVAENLILEKGEKKNKTKQKKQQANKKHPRFNCPCQKAAKKLTVVSGHLAEASVSL